MIVALLCFKLGSLLASIDGDVVLTFQFVIIVILLFVVAAQERSRGSVCMTRCPRGTEGSAEAARTDAARKVDACAFSMLVSSYGAACAPLVSARVACLELV